ncbi:MAG: N-acetylmuramoyl-L-alanine amidase [Acidobacteriaceae bacterium]
MRSSPPFRARLLCAFAGALLLSAGSWALASQSATAFARAGHWRARLEREPPSERTRAEYERVLDAYRAIYHRDPAAAKADASIVAVAELLTEEGHLFHDDKSYRDAIGQYEFLRAQYPASPYRENALLTEGEIWQRDLHDTRRARVAYREYLRLYPRSDEAAEARAALAGGFPRAAAPVREMRTARMEEPIPAHTERPVAIPAERPTVVRTEPVAEPAAEMPVSEERAPAVRGRLPLVTGIRHWSTPVYTRVAIDLQKEVQYEAVRVPNPDRVYFDLYGARLAPGLKGHWDRVTDDGFLKGIRVMEPSQDVTRIVLSVSSLSDYSAFFLPNPPRLIIDVHGRKGALVAPARTQVARSVFPAAAPVARTQTRPTVRTGVFPGVDSDQVNNQADQVRATPEPTTEPVADTVAGTTPAAQPETWRRPVPRSVASTAVRNKPSAAVPATTATMASPAIQPAPVPTSVPTSMVRALGLKINRIVIDAGHGGHDSGTLGPGGIEEKDVVLDVALRLGRLLHERLGSEVIYTRKTDTFIPLETRTAIANQAQADLFISIHANSSSDPTVNGVETYYLNFTTSADALQVAARENAVSNESIFQLSSLVKRIAMDTKIDESREFAADVNESLYDGLEQGSPAMRNRGVKKAPFVVLIGANMPSILAEISFLTNPEAAEDLRRPAYRERIAEALYRGVAEYVGSLNGVRVAQAGTRTGSQE